jgi:hypothetical protein
LAGPKHAVRDSDEASIDIVQSPGKPLHDLSHLATGLSLFASSRLCRRGWRYRAAWRLTLYSWSWGVMGAVHAYIYTYDVYTHMILHHMYRHTHVYICITLSAKTHACVQARALARARHKVLEAGRWAHGGCQKNSSPMCFSQTNDAMTLPRTTHSSP